MTGNVVGIICPPNEIGLTDQPKCIGGGGISPSVPQSGQPWAVDMYAETIRIVDSHLKAGET